MGWWGGRPGLGCSCPVCLLIPPAPGCAPRGRRPGATHFRAGAFLFLAEKPWLHSVSVRHAVKVGEGGESLAARWVEPFLLPGCLVPGGVTLGKVMSAPLPTNGGVSPAPRSSDQGSVTPGSPGMDGFPGISFYIPKGRVSFCPD